MVTELLFSIGASLTANAIDRQISKNINFLNKKKINAKIDEIVIAVMEPVSAFLKAEGVPDLASKNMIDEAKPMITWLTDNPEFAFNRGLDAELITKDLLEREKSSTRGVKDDYPGAFETILRSFVDLATKTPPVFQAWEKSSFQTMFRQTEDIKSTLSQIYDAMMSVAASQGGGATDFERITNHRATTIALKTNIHGLRQTAVPQEELDNLFVFPEFHHISEKDRENDYSDHPFEINIGDEVSDYSGFLRLLLSSAFLVVRAPAGAGKTTFSNWLTSRLLNNNPRLFPIVLPLRQIIKSSNLPSLTEAFASSTSSVFSEMIQPGRVSNWAEEKKIVIIFEGFDEVGEGDRDKILDWITAMKAAHPNLLMMITSRPLSTSHLDVLIRQGWNDLRMMPFNTERVVTYIQRFQKYGPDIQTGAKLRNPEELARAWRSDPTLGPLTGNPLLLSTLLVVHHMDGELPDDRSKLYERYIDGMLGLWELNKDLAAPIIPLTKEQKKKILELIAINMISSETDAASEENVAIWIDSYIKEENVSASAKGILDHLRERSGLLIGPGQYTFAHKSIGEFLVAQACNDGIQTDINGVRFDRWLLKESCLKDRWTTVTFLWAGVASKNEVQRFISSLIEDGHLELAGGLLIERRKFLDRRWICSQFWRWVEHWTNRSIALPSQSNAFMRGIAPVASLNPNPDRMDIVGLTSINGNDTDETDLISAFFESDIIKPEDWEENSIRLNPLMWLEFSSHGIISENFFDSRPESISDACAGFSIIKNYLLREQKSKGNKSDYLRKSFLSDRVDILSIEAIIFLELYAESKQVFYEYRGRNDEGSIIKFYMRRIKEFEISGSLKKVFDTPPEEFGDLLHSSLSEEFDGGFFFHESDNKSSSFSERCRSLLETESKTYDFTEYEHHVKAILAVHDKKSSSIPA